MNRNLFFYLILISSPRLWHIKAKEDEITLNGIDFANIQMKLWVNLNNNIEFIMQKFEKIDNSFTDVNKELTELNRKLDANGKNMKKQMEIIEKKIENLEQNAEYHSKLVEIQNKAKFEKLENMLKIQNIENQNLIENFTSEINDNNIKLVSMLDRLQNEAIKYESSGNHTKNALQNIENKLKSEYNKIESKTELYSKLNEYSLKEIKSTLDMLKKNIESGRPTDCSQWNSNYCQNSKCSIHNQIYGSQTFWVACDQQTDNGGWTVIQRRINGTVDFYRDWQQYKVGFGHLDGEFWLGLDKLHALTSAENMELRIVLTDFNDTEKYANYNSFKIANETEKYALKIIGEYSGNAGNSFGKHLGLNFTTKDQDNHFDGGINCAISKTGAWWYEACGWSNLNGKYYQQGKLQPNERGINWSEFHGYEYSMKHVQMMIRPRKLEATN